LIICEKKKDKLMKLIRKRREKELEQLDEEIKDLMKKKTEVFEGTSSRSEAHKEVAPIVEKIRKRQERRSNLLNKLYTDKEYGEAKIFMRTDNGRAIGFINVLILEHSVECPYKNILVVGKDTALGEVIIKGTVGSVGVYKNGRARTEIRIDKKELYSEKENKEEEEKAASSR